MKNEQTKEVIPEILIIGSGIAAVSSTKAARLKRIKPGYFNPPTDRPIFVPGFNWLQVLVTGLKGTAVLAHLCWWTTRGEKASKKRLEEGKILKKVQELWGRKVIHLWDRGFAGSPWTKLALDHHLRFILRWNKTYHLVGPDGRNHEVWKISRGKRSWEYRMIWDARRRCLRKTGVIALPIHLPDDDRQLFLVVSRPGYARKPWYLITTNPFSLPNKPGRLSLPTPNAGRSKCPCVSPSPNWPLSLHACILGRRASSSF